MENRREEIKLEDQFSRYNIRIPERDYREK